MTVADSLAKWAKPMPGMGAGAYRLTEGPSEHKHHYHIVCPWSMDGSQMVLLRYTRDRTDAELCMQGMNDGALRVIARPKCWNAHSAAFEQWQGDRDRIMFVSDRTEESCVTTTIKPDGSDARSFETTDMDVCLKCSPDGRYGYGNTPGHLLFPNDELAPRHDKGVMRLDLDNGKTELVFSLEDALSLFPDRDEIAHCHLYTKMTIPHLRTGRILFNVANAVWDAALGEPRVRGLVAVNPDGSDPAYLGKPLHHPNWHPTDERVLCNVKDFNDKVRFGLYNGDGSGLLEYVRNVKGSGHPSFSPDGKWIFTDGRSWPNGDAYVILCDPVAGREIVAAEFRAYSADYASRKAVNERAEGETIIAALQRASRPSADQPRKTDGHPSWSRDGSVVLFNADLGDGSQLYAVDVARTVEAA